MPKIRGIKPETWTDENFVELTPLARLLFIGLWNYACDNGHVEDKPKQIKMRILPADDCNSSDLLRELAENDRIVREGGWITVPTLREHQRIDKRWFVACEKPGCEKPDAKKADSQPEPRGGHDEATTRPPRNPDVASQGPRDDVDVDVELMVTRGDGETSGDKSPTPPGTQLALVNDGRDDVERICEHLAEQIEARGSKRPAITARWRNEARLLIDNDQRGEEQVHACIRWLFTSNHRDAKFWRTNVRSMPKLREEYDRLRELAEQPAGSTNRQQETDDLFDRAARRMGLGGTQ
jgi:hypothetical protein